MVSKWEIKKDEKALTDDQAQQVNSLKAQCADHLSSNPNPKTTYKNPLECWRYFLRSKSYTLEEALSAAKSGKKVFWGPLSYNPNPEQYDIPGFGDKPVCVSVFTYRNQITKSCLSQFLFSR